MIGVDGCGGNGGADVDVPEWVVVLQVLQLQVQQVVLVLLRHHVVQYPRRLLEQVVEANDQYVVE